jgi:pimeloyl-ACP methyl ester carboxylesterase
MNTDTEQPAPYGRHYRVNGHDLLLHRTGAGNATVVLLPGGGSVGLDLWLVQAGVAEFAEVVSYDRGGTGWSSRDVALPRGLGEVGTELLDLLGVAGIAGPYILVGHSLGGFYARHLAAGHPESVAGLVLVETGHEDFRKYMPKELTDLWDAFEPGEALPDELPKEITDFYRGLFEQEMSAWPAEVRDPLVANHVHPRWLGIGMLEGSNIKALNEEMRAAGPVPDVPTVFLTAMDVDPFKRATSMGVSDEALQAEIDGKARLYDELAASFSRGENRRVAGVGHVTLLMRRPDAVVEAVRDVMGRLRPVSP